MTGPQREMTAAEERAFLKSRLHDYDRAELSELRAKLAGRWKEQFPEAAKETSDPFEPLVREEELAEAGRIRSRRGMGYMTATTSHFGACRISASVRVKR